jgi:DNA-binding HxlR family transcriptional regulator
MPGKSYHLFCPLAMACEIIEPRWTLLILAEMWDGSTRFNDIRRGVPGISPTLLSRRLKEMEARGLVERLENRGKGTVDYVRTPLAIELEQAMMLLGDWAYRNVQASVALHDTNPDYLMWQICRTLDPAALPHRRVVVRFRFVDVDANASRYWLVAKPGAAIDLCMFDPGFDVDLYVDSEVSDLAAVWMGYASLASKLADERVYLSGDPLLIRSFDRWIGRCAFAEPREDLASSPAPLPHGAPATS